MIIIEFVGGTSVGKSILVSDIKKLDFGERNASTHFEFILKCLKINYNKWTYYSILHLFLYFQFLWLCIRKRCLFYEFFVHIFQKEEPYPFVIKLKLCNNLIRTFGAMFFLKDKKFDKNQSVVLVDEGPIQMIHNIITKVDGKINCKLWEYLLSLIPDVMISKIIIMHDTNKSVAIRSLKRSDPAFGCKKLSFKQWLSFARNNKKSFTYLESLLGDKILCVIRPKRNKLNVVISALMEKLNIAI
jgi:hypothetical protein